MTNEERANLDFISQLTDVSKWDLAGLNSVTGYKDPEETTGIEDLENLAAEMQSRFDIDDDEPICAYCGELGTEDFPITEYNLDYICNECKHKEIEQYNSEHESELKNISDDIESQGYLNGRNY